MIVGCLSRLPRTGTLSSEAHSARTERPAIGREAARDRDGASSLGKPSRGLGYAEVGVDALLGDRMRRSGRAPPSTETLARILALTCSEPPG